MKTIKRGLGGADIVAYQDADLEDIGLQQILGEAKRDWADRIATYVHQHGDVGSCVLGAGIAVWYLPPRCRKPRKKVIINPHVIVPYQGSVTWEVSANIIVDYLKKNGIECWFEYGRMD